MTALDIVQLTSFTLEVFAISLLYINLSSSELIQEIRICLDEFLTKRVGEPFSKLMGQVVYKVKKALKYANESSFIVIVIMLFSFLFLFLRFLDLIGAEIPKIIDPRYNYLLMTYLIVMIALFFLFVVYSLARKIFLKIYKGNKGYSIGVLAVYLALLGFLGEVIQVVAIFN